MLRGGLLFLDVKMRRRIIFVWVLVLLGVIAFGVRAPAPLPVPPTAPAVDPLHDAVAQQAEAELAAQNPAAVPIFQAASAAYYTDHDLDAARAGFEQVLALAPENSHALRMLSEVAHAANDPTACLDYAQRAVAAAPTGLNHSTLAWAYLYLDTPEANQAAYTEVKLALNGQFDDADTVLAWFFAANGTGHTREAKLAAAQYLAAAPWSAYAHYLAGLFAADEGRYEQSELELQLALRLGMAADQVASALRDEHITSQAFIVRWLRRESYLAAGWVALFAALTLVGGSLSSRFQATVQTAIDRGALPNAPGEARRRAAYRRLLSAASAFFYLTVPLALVSLAAAGVMVAYLFQVHPGGPAGWAAIAGLVLGLPLLAILRGLWVWSRRPPAPGRPLTRAEAPALWALVEDVARRLNTPAATAIYVVPYFTLFMLEGGSLWQWWRRRSPRYLLLGLGCLPGLSVEALRALLAHEYGILAEGDTAGGRRAARMRLALGSLAYRLAKVRFRAIDLLWHFVTGYQQWFQDKALGAARLQVLLADAAAAQAYGHPEYLDALRRIGRQELVFSEQVQLARGSAQAASGSLPNIYAQPFELPAATVRQLETRLYEIQAHGYPRSNYPALYGRLRLVDRLPPDHARSDHDRRPAWDLLRYPEQLQAEMLNQIADDARKNR